MVSQKTVLILTGDLKGAYQKWCDSGNRWKEHWYETCDEIYKGKVCKKSYKKAFVFDPTTKTISKRKFEVGEHAISYTECEDIDNKAHDKELLYFIFMKDADGKIIYYKVGTTTREIETRMKEHLEYYEEEGIKNIEIVKVIDCKGIPAEGLESYIRAQMIRVHPTAFKKNDRFIADEVAEMDLTLVDKWANEYLRGAD